MGWQGLGSKTEDFLVDEHTADDVPSSGYVDDMDEWTSWFDTEWDVYAASASIKKLDEAETCAAGAVSTSQFSGADTGSGSQATVRWRKRPFSLRMSSQHLQLRPPHLAPLCSKTLRPQFTGNCRRLRIWNWRELHARPACAST